MVILIRFLFRRAKNWERKLRKQVVSEIMIFLQHMVSRYIPYHSSDPKLSRIISDSGESVLSQCAKNRKFLFYKFGSFFPVLSRFWVKFGIWLISDSFLTQLLLICDSARLFYLHSPHSEPRGVSWSCWSGSLTHWRLIPTHFCHSMPTHNRIIKNEIFQKNLKKLNIWIIVSAQSRLWAGSEPLTF